MALLSFYVKCGRAHGPSGAGRFHSGLFARRRRSAPSWPCRALLLAVAVLRTVRHVLRIGQDVRSILRRPAAQTPAAMGLLHRRWRDLPPPQPCPPTTTRTAATARATARFPARSLARSPARAPEEAGIEASGNRRLPASQELQPDESGFVEGRPPPLLPPTTVHWRDAPDEPHVRGADRFYTTTQRCRATPRARAPRPRAPPRTPPAHPTMRLDDACRKTRTVTFTCGSGSSPQCP